MQNEGVIMRLSLILFHHNKSFSFRGVYEVDQFSQKVRILTLLMMYKCILICCIVCMVHVYINNPVTRELTFFVSKSCDPDFKQAVKRHRVGTLAGC